MKRLIIFVFLLCIFGIVGCSLFTPVTPNDPSSPANPRGGGTIDPRNANALSNAISISGGNRVNGNPPSPSTSRQAPNLTAGNRSLTTSNGSALPFSSLNFTSSNNITGLYVQVAGANNYFDVPLSGGSGIRSGNVTINPVMFPQNLRAGRFTFILCIYDNRGLVSNIERIQVTVVELGSGDLQISLSWDNTADVDLHVTDPNNERIYFANRRARSGGALDRDDTNGFGPENVFWSNPPRGRYTIEVDHFSGSSPANYVITVTGSSGTRTYRGSVSRSDRGRRRVVVIDQTGSPQTENSGLSYGRFRVTSVVVDATTTADNVANNQCRTEFGSNYRVADWQDIVDFFNSATNAQRDEFYDGLGLTLQGSGPDVGYLISVGGSEIFSGRRHYNINRFFQNARSGYLVHRSHRDRDNLLTVGSWWQTRHALCYNQSR